MRILCLNNFTVARASIEKILKKTLVTSPIALFVARFHLHHHDHVVKVERIAPVQRKQNSQANEIEVTKSLPQYHGATRDQQRGFALQADRVRPGNIVLQGIDNKVVLEKKVSGLNRKCASVDCC
jgi:hypothetical protein